MRVCFVTPKTQPKRDWSDYNKKMKMRGDMAIMTVHEIRQVFKLPLRQFEGFVNAKLK